MTRRRLGGALAAAVLVVSLALLSRPGPTPAPPRAVDTDRPAAAMAADACAGVLVDLAEQVRRDAPAQEVLAGLRGTEQLAVAARDADPRYVPLASGVAALRVALNDDDAEAAAVAIDVVVAACADTEVTT